MDLPAPVHDVIQGQVVRPKNRSHLLLILGDASLLRFPVQIVASGTIYLSYAFALYVNDDALLPQFVLDDFRRSYTGLDAIRFLRQKGDTYPRADVIGRGAVSGRYREHYLKEVDLGSPMKVAVYADEELQQFIGFLDMVLQIDAKMTSAAWSEITPENALPPLVRIVPCVQVHPNSVTDALAELLET